MARLCVSQLGWQNPFDRNVLELLRDEGVQALEVTPSKLIDGWQDATSDRATAFAADMRAGYGLEVSAFQAIFYGVDGIHVFYPYEARLKLCDHTERVARFAAAMGARVLVFGAPRLRDPGDLSDDDALNHAVPVFRELARICHAQGVTLGIEANPADYGCRFITHAAQAAALVERVEHPGLRIHLDTGGMILNREDVPNFMARWGRFVCHVHISEPHLADFSPPSPAHQQIATALANYGYRGDVSIELLARPEDQDPCQKIKTAIDAVRRIYREVLR